MASAVVVFLAGEGRHDIGGLALSPPFQDDSPGFVQPIVERLAGTSVTFKGRKIAALGKARFKGLEDVLAHKAAAATAFAENDHAHVLVFITDVDAGEGRRTRKQGRREVRTRVDTILAGRQSVEGAAVKCVAGAPCRTIEAWALGDLTVLARLTSGTTRLPAGKGPEDLWGAPRDPKSNHPKSVLRRILGRPAQQQDMADIARDADVDVLREKCAISFEPFVDALEAALS